jgi:uncharacterized damage-inducible protein DinB
VTVNVDELLAEAFGRLPDLVQAAVRGLTAEELHTPPAKGANTVGWLVWHLTRVQDSHIAELTDADQVYITGDWAPKFGLRPDPGDTGYGYTAEQVQAVQPSSAKVLTDYYQAVHDRTAAYLSGLKAADLDKVVDEAWDPPVTLAVRLVSILNDDTQHAGQAAYVRGLLKN